MGYPITQSTTTRPLLFFMGDETDPMTGVTGLTGGTAPTVTICKLGGAFGAPAGAISEIGNGWYQVAGNATDSNTLGPLLLKATGTGCAPTNDCFEVVAFNPHDAVRGGLTALPNVAQGNSGQLALGNASGQPTVVGFVANAITTAAINDGAITAAKFAANALDAVWSTAARSLTTFGTLVADVATAVWAAATRVLTAGTNIVLAKGTGITGFNDPTAAENADAVFDEALSGHTTDGTAGKNLADLYAAQIDFTRDGSNTRDEYTVRWFKNGVRVTSGITVPTVQVVKRADGTDLVASTTMTQIASTGSYKYDTTTSAERLAEGESAEVVVSATIGGSTRTWSKMVSRDAAEE